jgi:hypothetical protein
MNGLGAFSTAALISAEVDAVITASTSEMPGRLVFSTTADGASSPTERMRIANNGAIAINTGGTIYNSGIMSVSSGGNGLCGTFRSAPTSGTVASIIFEDGAGTDCGSIDVNTSANTTAYTTSSDYRLKQDIKPLAGSIGRVLQLKPCEWNWISSPETRGEGFIAHEAQAVVPECATGVKDEIDDEGNPVYQGIDQSKLVPLLTAALQEALAKIETLEARLTAAGL